MGNEVVQEAELASGERDEHPVGEHPPTGDIDDEVAGVESRLAGGMRSTQQRADARCELAEVERLREVVVGTGIETGDPINDRNREP